MPHKTRHRRCCIPLPPANTSARHQPSPPPLPPVHTLPLPQRNRSVLAPPQRTPQRSTAPPAPYERAEAQGHGSAIPTRHAGAGRPPSPPHPHTPTPPSPSATLRRANTCPPLHRANKCSPTGGGGGRYSSGPQNRVSKPTGNQYCFGKNPRRAAPSRDGLLKTVRNCAWILDGAERNRHVRHPRNPIQIDLLPGALQAVHEGTNSEWLGNSGGYGASQAGSEFNPQRSQNNPIFRSNLQENAATRAWIGGDCCIYQ
eukprot:COSAG02_NODE_26_length_51927_cov_61.213881_27_plen_257_part_00